MVMGMMICIESSPPPTIQQVLRLLWEADRYPHLGNEDNRVVALLEKEAFALACHAVPSLGDPPEFAKWLSLLQDQKLSADAHDTIMAKLNEIFDADFESAKGYYRDFCPG